MFNKHILEKKSHYNSSQNYNGFYSFYDSYTGDFVGGVHKLSFAEQIRKNVPIQTIISNQLGIINSAELQILKRDKDKTDLPTTYKPALDFLNILQNPNFNPSPQNWNAIVRGLYKPYLSNGIVALVLKGAKSKTIDSVEIASSVTYNNSNNVITYNIQTTGKGYSYTRIFEEEELVLNKIFYTNGNDIAIIFGNFDDYLKCYQTVLQPLMDVILWSNNIITASNMFYENSCRPSSIITVKFLDGYDEKGNPMYGKDANKDMAKIIAEIKTQLKGSANTGKVILPSQPNLDITVTPLSITQNANDIKEQLALTAQMIYSAFTGYNKDIIEGKSEYAGNREMSLKEQYDSTVTTFTNIILDELNAFLPKWLQYVGKAGDILDRQGIYLNFDISGIQRYKDAKIAEAIELAKSQIIDREEARTKIRQYKDDYADLRILSDAENGFIGEKKSNTL